jgi:gliding motility-associated-like protein
MKIVKLTKYFVFLISCFVYTFVFAQQDIQSSKDTICQENTITFTDTNSIPMGLNVISREWTFGDGNTLTSSSANITYTYNTFGLFSVSLKINYDIGPAAIVLKTTPIKVFKSPVAGFTIDKTTTCNGVAVIFTPNNINGQGTLITRTIEYGDGAKDTNFVVLKNHAFAVRGNYSPTVYLMDNFGCGDTLSKTISVVAPPKISFEPVSLLCKDTIVFYNNTTQGKNSPNYQWNWQFINTKGIPTSLNTVDGINTWDEFGFVTVNLNLLDINTGCQSTANLVHLVDTIPSLNITPSPDTVICFGESIKYNIQSANRIFFEDSTWMDKISGDSIVLVSPQNTYLYKVYTKNTNCPRVEKQIKVSVLKNLPISISAKPTQIVAGSVSHLKVNINGSWDSVRWSPTADMSCSKCDSTGASPLSSTYYKANVYYSLNNKVCSSSDSVFIEVNPDCNKEDIIIPTGFTPNGDLLNDEFYPKGYALKEINDFKIYNRWGNQVYGNQNFNANDKRFGWNGRVDNSGEELQPGAYYYTIIAKCSNGKIINFQGEIILIR